MSKGTRIGVFVFLLFFTVLSLGKDHIATQISVFSLKKYCQKSGRSVGTIQTKGNTIVIRDFSSSGFFAETVEIVCHVSLFPPVFAPEIGIPDCIVRQSDTGNFGFVPVSSRFLRPIIRIEKGQFVDPCSSREFDFRFFPSDRNDSIGCLTVREGESEPFLEVEIFREENTVRYRAEVFDADLSYALPWIAARFPEKEILSSQDKTRGKIRSYAEGTFGEKGDLLSLRASATLENVEWEGKSSLVSFGAKLLSATVSFTREKGKTLANGSEIFLTFEEAMLVDQKKEIGLADALGEIRFGNGSDPYCKVTGIAIGSSLPMPFEAELQSVKEQEDSSRIFGGISFSLPESSPVITFSRKSLQGRPDEFDIHWSEVGPELSSVYEKLRTYFGGIDLHIEEGKSAGRVVGNFDTFELSDFVGSNLHVSLPSKHLSGKAEEIRLSATVKDNKIEAFRFLVTGGESESEGVRWEKIYAKGEASEGKLLSSYCQGRYFGVEVSVGVFPPSSDTFLHLECTFYPDDIRRSFFPNTPPLPVDTHPAFLVLDKKEEGPVSGILRLPEGADQPRDIFLEGNFQKEFGRDLAGLSSLFRIPSFEGSFHSKELALVSLFPYAKEAIASFGLQGSCDISGSFSEKTVTVDFSSVEISGKKGEYRFFLSTGDIAPVRLTWDPGLQTVTVLGTIEDGVIENMARSVTFQIENTPFTWQDGSFRADRWSGSCEDIAFSGSVVSDREKTILRCNPCTIEFDAAGKLFSRLYPEISLREWEGKLFFLGGEYGIDREGKEIGCSGSMAITDLTKTFSDTVSITGGKCTLGIEGHRITCKNLEAKCRVGTFTWDLSGEDWTWNGTDPTVFSIVAAEGSKQALLLRGKASSHKDHVVVAWDPGSHLLGLPIHIEPVTFGTNGLLFPVRGKIEYTWESLPAYEAFRARILPSIPSFSFSGLRGNGQLEWSIEKDLARFRIFGKNFFVQEIDRGPVDCSIVYRTNSVEVGPCSIGPYSFKGRGVKEGEVWNLQDLILSSEALTVSARAGYSPKLGRLQIPAFSASSPGPSVPFQIQGSFEDIVRTETGIEGRGVLDTLALYFEKGTFVAAKGTTFTLSDTGCTIENGLWQRTEEGGNSVRFRIPKIEYHPFSNRFRIEGAEGKELGEWLLPRWKEITGDETAVCKKDLGAKFDIDWSPSRKKLSAIIRNGEVSAFGIQGDLTAFQWLEEKGDTYLLAGFVSGGVKLEAGRKKHTSGSEELYLREEGEGEGVRVVIDKKEKSSFLRSAEGSVLGWSVRLEPTGESVGTDLVYRIALQGDFGRLAPVLPKTFAADIGRYRLGEGYAFEGNLFLGSNPFSVNGGVGEIRGERFSCLGKIFRKCSSKIRFSRESVRLREVLWEDDSGSLSAKQIDLRKSSSGKWEFFIPVIHAKEIDPSAFFPEKKTDWVMKNISLHRCKGFLSDRQTWEGTGALHFAGSVKKEFSLWDIPGNLIKDLGLDPAILTPVRGEAEFFLARGRCYFTGLKNTYSEGERSRFDLASPQPESYLGFDGTWHVDLQMKQNVLLKVAENWILTVRGSLDKPKYGFKKRDKER